MSVAPQAASVKIRTATLADAERLAPLATQLGYASTAEQIAARLPAVLSDPESVIFVAERNDGELLGYADVFLMRTLASDARAEVGGLVVADSCRSQGIGQMLMARVEEWAREKRCAAVSLRTNVIRERAHTFYERLGYTLVKTQKAYRKKL
jgi:GNAT superfamily N-acetyltransferase